MRDKDAKLIWEARFWPFKGKSKGEITPKPTTYANWRGLKDNENLVNMLRSATGPGIGAAVGTAVGGPAGTFLGAGIGKLTQDVFDSIQGKKKKETIIKLFDEGMLKGEATLKKAARDQNLINKAKELNIKNNKFLTCENCGLQPANSNSKQEGKPFYPGMNESNASRIIEGHHVVPIHLGERKSTVDDILCLCRNCHSLYHIVTNSEL